MNKRYHALAAAGALTFSGCVSPAPRKAYEDVGKTAGERLPSLPRLGSSAGELAVKERTHALLTSGPLTADKVVELALLNNPSLAAESENVAVARADLAQAGLLENPRVHYGLRRGAGTTGYEFSALMNFMDLATLPLSRKLASGRYEQARLRVSQEVLALAADVKTAFYAAQAAQQRAALRKTAYETFQAASELLDRQRQAGNINALDHAREKAAAERAGVDLARTEAAAQQARERLAALMGVQDMGPWTLDESFADPPSAEPELAKLEDAARREPGILKDALTINRLGLFGSISAGFDAEKGIGEPSGSGPAVEFNVPLFDFQRASSARIKAQMRRSALTIAALETQIRLEVRLAYSELAAAREAAQRYKTALLPLSDTVADETLKHYDFMLLGVYDVLKARREQFETRSEYIESLRDYWTAWSDLERALGGRIPPELASTPAPAEQPKAEPAAPQHQHDHEGDTP